MAKPSTEFQIDEVAIAVREALLTFAVKDRLSTDTSGTNSDRKWKIRFLSRIWEPHQIAFNLPVRVRPWDYDKKTWMVTRPLAVAFAFKVSPRPKQVVWVSIRRVNKVKAETNEIIVTVAAKQHV